MSKKLSADFYLNEQLDFDRELIKYRYETIKPYFKVGNALELGCGDGEMTRYLINDFLHLTTVDGSRELLDVIPEYTNHTKVHSYFETFEPNAKYETIILEHILEHVDDPVHIMCLAKEWLKDNGVMICGVPNANSIHRLAAVKMGLLKSPTELNARDHSLGHQRVYDFDSFERDIRSAQLNIIAKGGVFLKPLSNVQIEKDWTKEMMDGFHELGKDFPNIAAEIYCICNV